MRIYNNFKLLILGGSGFLSSYLFSYFENKYQIYVIYNKKYIKYKKFKYFKLQKINLRNIENIINFIQPKLIINAMAYTKIDDIENEENIAYNLNTLLPKYLSITAKKNSIKLIHISSDQIYDGKKNIYFEKTKTSPINIYARQKVEAENFIKKNTSNYLILRTNFFGFSRKKEKSFNQIYESLKKNKILNYYGDIFYNPIYILDLIKIMDKLILLNSKGVYNVSSDEKISKYDFVLMICKIFNLSSSKVNKINTNKTSIFSEKRPKCMYLSNNKIKKKLKIKSISISSGLMRLRSSILKNTIL